MWKQALKSTAIMRVIAVLGGMVTAFYIRGTPGEELCVARSYTVFNNTCRSAGTDCAGGCYRLQWDGCNDCVQGNDTCSPPSVPCVAVMLSTGCVTVAGGGCVCSGNWKRKEYPGAQMCN